MKTLTWSFPLHPDPFYGRNHEKRRGLELVTNLSLSYKTCLEKFCSDPLNLETVERKGERTTNYWISQELKEIFRENKNDFP